MKTGARIALALLASVSATGAGEVLLVSATSAESLERRLRAPAEQGFRLLAAAQGSALGGGRRVVAVLRRTAGQAPYEYAVRSIPGDLGADGALETINERAAHGFRIMPDRVFPRPLVEWWLPESAYEDQSIVVMEREPGAVARHYETLAYSRPGVFHDALFERYRDDYGIVGLWKTFRRPRLLLERPRAHGGGPAIDDPRPYLLLIPPMKRALKRGLKQARLDGYRVVDSADRAILAPPMVLFERTGRVESRRLKYRVWRNPLKRVRNESLARRLNKKARRGYRALPRSISDEMVVLERDDAAPLWRYRAVSDKRSPGLPLALERALDDGFRIVALFHASDETTVLVAGPSAVR